MEIDQDNLQTGIAIGCRTSQEFCSNYLFLHLVDFHFRAYIEWMDVQMDRICLVAYGFQRATKHYLACGITQCYLPLDMDERTLL